MSEPYLTPGQVETWIHNQVDVDNQAEAATLRAYAKVVEAVAKAPNNGNYTATIPAELVLFARKVRGHAE